MIFKHKSSEHVNRLTVVQILLTFYFLAIVISTILLSLPIAYKPGVQIAFIDVLFTAVSALSVTGLSAVSIADIFSTTGIILLGLILQLGAVGVMSIGTFIWLLLGKKIGFQERRLIMTDQNQTSFAGMVKLIRDILIVLMTIELVSFLILGTYFLKYYPTISEAYLHGFFSMISAISNGGFDITGNSLIPFKHDYFIQISNMLLIIIGAIGFPVLIECKKYVRKVIIKKEKMRFSLFAKVTTITFFSLIVVGTIVIYLLDARHFFLNKSVTESFFGALFQSVTTRSGGLSTLDVSLLTESNQLFMSFLMFVGASPSSAGGGIRTTTFALVIIFLITYARGGESLQIFRREIHNEDLMKAVTVILMAIFAVSLSVLILSIVEPFDLTAILFEVTSAFGTVGLSLGITSEITALSKIVLMVLMFIGRVGVITFLFMFKPDRTIKNYHYPKERIIIG
ncbi:MAG TPA: TrkH family potassium uptake protein [Bacillota bacterium]|nr:TrkH family potassium uptake protein [Bacillota bacterium]